MDGLEEQLTVTLSNDLSLDLCGVRTWVLMAELPEIDPAIPPSGSGCVECLATDGWWFHLRRCAACGHIGCCDSSPSQHASHHAFDVGHPIVASFEPGEYWFWDYRVNDYTNGPALVAPVNHPLDQTTPGPEDRVPDDWQEHLR